MVAPGQNHCQQAFTTLREFISRYVIGQERLVSRMLIALLADGHLLVEGAPGLAKTRAVKTLAQGIEGSFQRIQFTPDLLPADLTGTDIFKPQEARFEFQAGPLFHDIVLADEVNRAPAKVQSALLEAMEEQQVTVGGRTYPLPQLFFVMATQNPLEENGTYPLPEAQLDRFLLKVTVDYPDVATEIQIMEQVRHEALSTNPGTKQPGEALPLPQSLIFTARRELLELHMAEPVASYIAHLVAATRRPAGYSEKLAPWLSHGASPRASLALDRCSRALAWLDRRDYVSPDDVQQVAHEVLRHRIIPSYQAELESLDADQIIDELLLSVPVG